MKLYKCVSSGDHISMTKNLGDARIVELRDEEREERDVYCVLDLS